MFWTSDECVDGGGQAGLAAVAAIVPAGSAALRSCPSQIGSTPRRPPLPMRAPAAYTRRLRRRRPACPRATPLPEVVGWPAGPSVCLPSSSPAPGPWRIARRLPRRHQAASTRASRYPNALKTSATYASASRKSRTSRGAGSGGRGSGLGGVGVEGSESDRGVEALTCWSGGA